MEQNNKYNELLKFARHSAEVTATSEGEMSQSLNTIAMYEDLKMGWINCCGGCLDDFDKYSSEAIEVYVDEYTKHYGVSYKQDSWGNYKILVKE